MRKKEGLVYLGLGIVFVLMLLLLFFYHQGMKKGGVPMVVIYTNGHKTAEYPLSENRTVELKGFRGGSNRLVIENGGARITSADCPDKICVHHKEIRTAGEQIVCLPHRLIVRIEEEGSRGTKVDDVLR